MLHRIHSRLTPKKGAECHPRPCLGADLLSVLALLCQVRTFVAQHDFARRVALIVASLFSHFIPKKARLARLFSENS